MKNQQYGNVHRTPLGDSLDLLIDTTSGSCPPNDTARKHVMKEMGVDKSTAENIVHLKSHGNRHREVGIYGISRILK